MGKHDIGDYTIQDAPSAGRPSEFDWDEVKCYVEDDPELTIRKISAKSEVFYYAIQTGLSRLRRNESTEGGSLTHCQIPTMQVALVKYSLC